MNETNLGEPVPLVDGVAQSAPVSAWNADTYQITAQYQPEQSSGYGSSSGTVIQVINRAELTVNADDQTVTYGDAVPDLTYTISGFVAGDTSAVVTGTPSLSTDYVAGTPVASSPVAITVAAGTLAADNYTFALQNGQITIVAAELTVTGITAEDKYYDGTTDATIDVSGASLVGVFEGDDVTLDTTGAVGVFEDSSVGSDKRVVVSGLEIQGGDMGNYTLVQPETTASILEQAGTLSATLVDGELLIVDSSPDGAANSMTVTRDGTDLVIRDANEPFIAAPAGGTLSGDKKTLTIPLSLVTGSLIVDLAGGTDLMNVGSLGTGFPSFQIMGENVTDVVNFNGSITFAADHGLTVVDVGTVNLPNAASEIVATGTGAVSMTALRNIALGSGSSITTADGDITLDANQQTQATDGNFVGIDVDGGTIEVTGSGTVTLRGRGGDDAGGNQYGVHVRNGGQVIGGDSGDGVVIIGTGGDGTGNANHGVQLSGSGAYLFSTPIRVAYPGCTNHEWRNNSAFAGLKSDGSVVTWAVREVAVTAAAWQANWKATFRRFSRPGPRLRR